MDLKDILFNNELKLVMFDMDGTLVDSISRHIPTRTDYIEHLIKNNIIDENNRDKAYELIKGPISTLHERLMDNKISVIQALDLFGEIYINQGIYTPDFDGAIDSIQLLKSKNKLIGSVTASLPAIASYNYHVLQIGWDKRGLKGKVFDAEVIDDKVNHPELPVKPTFEAYKLLLNRLGNNYDLINLPTVYIGDGKSDLEFAENIRKNNKQIDFIYIHNNNPDKEILKGSTLDFKNMKEFYDSLK